MKTLLECKADQLAGLHFCPICGSSLLYQYWSQEEFPGEISSEDYLPNSEDKLSIQFECTLEIGIDGDDEIHARRPCPYAMDKIVEALDEEAQTDFGDQNDRACRECGCTQANACVTDDVPRHWVEDDICSACAAKGVAA